MTNPDQSTTKKQTTLSLPPDLVDEIDEFAEESHLNSRSKTVEILAREALEHKHADGAGQADNSADSGGGGRHDGVTQKILMLGAVSLISLIGVVLSICGALLLGAAAFLSLGGSAIVDIAILLRQSAVIFIVVSICSFLGQVILRWRDEGRNPVDQARGLLGGATQDESESEVGA